MDKISNAQRVALINQQAVFCLLNDQDISQLAELMKEVHFRQGKTITTEGELVDSFYIIVSGKSEVTKKIVSVDKSETIHIVNLTEGQSIGLTEAGFFSQSGLRTANATALSDMILLRIDLCQFYKFLNQPGRGYPRLSSTTLIYLLMHFIYKTRYFSKLTHDQLFQLAQKLEHVHFPPATVIYEPGQSAEQCYLILEGEVILQGGKAMADRKLHAHEVFGKEVFEPDGKRNDSAVAQTGVELLQLDKNYLNQFIPLDSGSRGNKKKSWLKQAISFVTKRLRKKDDK